MVNLKSAMTLAWIDLKKVGLAVKNAVRTVDVALQANAPKIQAGIQQASAVASVLDPALAPAISSFDKIEEVLMGEIATAFHAGNAAIGANGAAQVTLSAEVVQAIQSIVSTLSTHPSVIEASTPAKS